MASRKKGSKVSAGGRTSPSRVRRVLGTNAAKRKRPSSVEDLFGGGVTGNLLSSEFNTPDVYAWFQNRHAKGRTLITSEGYYEKGEHRWKVPYGLRCALAQPLMPVQVTTRYPFYATWVSPQTGKRLRRSFGSIIHAIDFIATKAQYVDSSASVCSKHGYDIPSKLRGKLPRKKTENGRITTYYWCPGCMTERRFRRTADTFFAMKKEWSDEKGRYVFKDRHLALLECGICGFTNRNHHFRRSNQPWEVRHLKPGVRRAKRRR